MKKQPKKLRTASLRHEREYFALGVRHIVGMDEAGRGAWAGPVAVGAVCLPVADKTLMRQLAACATANN
jgi:ribonuclease HII